MPRGKNPVTTTERLQPHNLDAERAVLGACLCERDLIVELGDRVRPADFYQRSHRQIFEAMLDLAERETPADLVLLVDELRRRGDLEAVGGEPYLSELIVETPATVHAGYYAEVVADLAARRRMIDAGTAIVRTAYEEARSWQDLVAETEALLAQATRGGPLGDPIVTVGSVVEGLLAGLDQGAGRLTGLGYPRLDELIGGVEDGDLVVLAGRPSSGKTSFALGTARHVAKKLGRRVLFVSLETRADKLLHRLLSQETGIDSRKIGHRGLRLEEFEREIVEEVSRQISSWPLVLDASGEGRIETVLSRTLGYHARQGLDLLIVDGLWLLEYAAARGDRVREVGKISRSLKLLAMKLGIPVIALHQLNRASLHRRDPTPVLSDLRESGDVEQDADLVVFVHRPGLIDLATDSAITRVIVAKHRQGPIGTISMRFEPKTTSFWEVRSA